MNQLSSGSRGGNVLRHTILIVLSFIAVFPMYWMFATSFKAPNAMYELSLFPANPTLENYRFVLDVLPFNRMLFNTFVMAGAQMVLQLITGLLSAYAFTRWQFFGKQIIFLLFALTWLVPFQVTMIPNYVLLSQLQWLNTLQALVIPHAASAFAILLLYQNIKAFPTDLIDSAKIDGASSWGILWRVIAPNLRAALAALGILLFISSWNEYFWPLLVTNKMERSVVQIGLQMFLTQEGDLWGPLMAGASLASLPIFVLYVALQRQVIDSFVKSGLR
ncbi:MAG: carbohydrate ABC transporter permease [Chloroflexota bacterium]